MNTHAERLVWLARENPDALLADLASACERSEAWTRKILKQAGIVPVKPPRAPRAQKPAPARSPRSIAASNTRQVKKLIAEAQSAGCIFERTAHFFQVQCPDDAIKAIYEPGIRKNADAVFATLFPPQPRYFRKKRVCKICKAGSGCRKRGESAVGHELVCPNKECGHACRSHFPEEVYPCMTFAAGCARWLEDDNGQGHRCDCPGWPPAPASLKATGRRKKTAPAPAPAQTEIELTETEA
jgi:hypothetical protein